MRFFFQKTPPSQTNFVRFTGLLRTFAMTSRFLTLTPLSFLFYVCCFRWFGWLGHKWLSVCYTRWTISLWMQSSHTLCSSAGKSVPVCFFGSLIWRSIAHVQADVPPPPPPPLYRLVFWHAFGYALFGLLLQVLIGFTFWKAAEIDPLHITP